MTDAHAKYFSTPKSRRSILKGLGAAAVGISLPGKKSPAWAEEEPKLNFYNWDTYIGETTLDDFKKASGIDVNMSLFATNDELFAKLRAGNPGFDVIVPGSEFVERMIQADLLEPLDHAKIPNIKNVTPEFINDAPYDPGRKYSMPYTWLVIGIGYRKSKVKEVPDSWKYLFDSDEYKGRIAVMSDASELFRNCLQISRPFHQRHLAGADQAGRGDAHQAEAQHQVLPRGQWPGPAGLGRGRRRDGI